MITGAGHTLAQGATGPPACQAAQLLLSADGDDGNFTGMSQNGSYLLLKNVSSKPCGFSPLPKLTLFDGRHSALPINSVVTGTEHMHPGPVVLPITIRPGQVVRSTLHWINGPVWVTKNGGVCLDTASVELTDGPSSLKAELQARICGPTRGKAKIEMTRFAKPAKQDAP